MAYASVEMHGLQGAARVVARPRRRKPEPSPDAGRSAAIHREVRRRKAAAEMRPEAVSANPRPQGVDRLAEADVERRQEEVGEELVAEVVDLPGQRRELE